jgi:hypothetical protein
MNSCCIEEKVVIHPVDGMQLADGYICMDESSHYLGILPGMNALVGDSVGEVLRLMDRCAKAFYGDDVVVEVVHHASSLA